MPLNYDELYKMMGWKTFDERYGPGGSETPDAPLGAPDKYQFSEGDYRDTKALMGNEPMPEGWHGTQEEWDQYNYTEQQAYLTRQNHERYSNLYWDTLQGEGGAKQMLDEGTKLAQASLRQGVGATTRSMGAQAVG